MASGGAREHRVEVLGTILLAVAAFAAAWSTFQSGRWRGEQALEGAKSQAARIGSTKASTRAGQLTQIDIATFMLFFAGISTKLRSARQKEILVGLGCVIFVSTAIWVATSPFSF